MAYELLLALLSAHKRSAISIGAFTPNGFLLHEDVLMKPNEYNPKAREAFGKSLIDIGVAIFKGIMLLFTVVPLSFLLKGALEGSDPQEPMSSLLHFMGSAAYFFFLGVLVLAFLLGYYFRKEGLRHLHEAENPRP